MKEMFNPSADRQAKIISIMAGGKETPRQKMIGMMYLVLTALLALNVSSSILEKFAFLNGGMEKSRDLAINRNEYKIDEIKQSVALRGNKPEEVMIAKESDNIHLKTKELLLYIEKLKTEMINNSGGLVDGVKAEAKIPSVVDEAQGMIPGAKNRDVVMELMLGGNKNGKAYELKERIDDYVSFLNSHSEQKHESFAYHGNEDPLTKNDPEQNSKDFAELNFEETPLIAALAVLSQLQSKITTVESEVIGEMKNKIALYDYKFDKVGLGVRPRNNIVAAGTKYKADMYIQASSSHLKPRMKWKLLGADDEVIIDTSEIIEGIGSFDFVASGGNYDDKGRSLRKWVGELSFTGPDGNEVTFMDTVDFTVTKPVMQIQSASISSLYLNCGNKLNIQVPALGEDYAPVFRVNGGRKEVGNKRGFVTIIPRSRNVKLEVISGGRKVGEQIFNVNRIPLPTIEIRNRGRKINKRVGFNSCPRMLEFLALADPSFKEALPEDANYMVLDGDVTLARGKRNVDQVSIRRGVANLASFCSQVRDGDRLVVEIKTVKRKNYKGELETVQLPDPIFQIPINL